jgi:hypothetical protein
MSVASISLIFAQFDLILIRLVVDLCVNNYTVTRYMKFKVHDPDRYHQEFFFFNEDELDLLDSTELETETKTGLDQPSPVKTNPTASSATYIV